MIALPIMPDPEREQWEALYGAALLELDREKLPARIRAAEDVLRQRLPSLNSTSDHRGERRAIEDALRNLRVLRKAEIPERGI
jgi:hypothetical protein